jgi:hypothetical protein
MDGQLRKPARRQDCGSGLRIRKPLPSCGGLFESGIFLVNTGSEAAKTALTVPVMRVGSDAAAAQGYLTTLRLLDHIGAGHTIDDRNHLVVISTERTEWTLGAAASAG